MKLKIKKLMSVDSTNIVAIDLIKNNKTKPTLVTADIQKKVKELWEKNGFLIKEICLFPYIFK